ncbi:ACHAA-like protein, partial [Mya arenaria]
MVSVWFVDTFVGNGCHVRDAVILNGGDANGLRTQLFITNAYDHRILPTNNQNTAVDVYIEFHLHAIIEVSETTETPKTTGNLNVTWNDAFLQWDPNDYGGIFRYHWPQKEVWKPDIALKNSYLDYKLLGVNELNIVNFYDGSMTVTSTLITWAALFMARLNTYGEEMKIPGWFASVMRVMKYLTCRRKRHQIAPIECANEEVESEVDEKVPHKSDQKTVEPEFTWKE